MTDNWQFAQWAMVALMAFQFFVTAILHGEPRGPYNVLGCVIDIGVLLAILIAGGFFA